MAGCFMQIVADYETNTLEIMRNNSDIRPDTFIDLGGRYMFNFDVAERTNDDGQVSFDFQSVIIPLKEKDEIVKAIIHDRYTLDDEIALVNNFNAGANIDEYNLYQSYRTYAKSIANAAIQEI